MSVAKTFVGIPCGKGHDGLRYESTGQCFHCSREWYQRNKQRKADEYQQRKESIKERKSEVARKYYQRNRERLLVQQKKYYEQNKAKWVNKAHKRRARGLPSHVKAEDLKRLTDLQQNKCAVCRIDLTKRHLDHIVPLSKGGTHEFKNLQFLCQSCNLNKHAKDPIIFMQSKGFLL